MAQPRYVTDIDKLTQIPEKDRGRLKAITEKFVFRENDYCLDLIVPRGRKEKVRS